MAICVAGAVAFARDVAPRRRIRRPANERTGWARPRPNAPLLEAGRQLAEEAAPRRPLRCAARRDRGGGDAAVRAGLPPRTRDLASSACVPISRKALVHAFFAERAVAKVPGVTDKTRARSPIRGGGDHRRRHDGRRHRDGLRQRGAARLAHRRLTGAARRGTGRHSAQLRVVHQARPVVAPKPSSERIGAIRQRSATRAVRRADVVIEAVFENIALKQQVFARLDAVARPGAMLATNTSMLDIDAHRLGDQAARRRWSACTSSARRT